MWQRHFGQNLPENWRQSQARQQHISTESLNGLTPQRADSVDYNIHNGFTQGQFRQETSPLSNMVYRGIPNTQSVSGELFSSDSPQYLWRYTR